MADKVILNSSTVADIADAIREKTGKTDKMIPGDMPGEIAGIESGGIYEKYLTGVISRGITEIVIPEEVTNIGGYALYRCTSLALVELPDNLAEIGDYAFEYCEALPSISIPASVKVIGQSFEYSGLSEVTFKGTPNEIDSYAFYNCSSLQTINVPWSEGKVNYAPWGAESATINYNYKEPLQTAVSNSEAMFETAIFASEPNFKSVDTAGKIVLNSSTMTDIADAIRSKTGKEDKMLPGDMADEISKIVIGNADEEIEKKYKQYLIGILDKSITEVAVPNGTAKIGNRVFRDCKALGSVSIPSSVKVIDDGAFENNDILSSVSGMEGVLSIGGNAFRNCKLLNLEKLPEKVTEIGEGAFYNCDALALTKLPNGITSISKDAFSYCASLALTELPEGITDIGDSAFAHCDSLALTELPDSVTDIDNYAFLGCPLLALTKLPEGITDISLYAFRNCRSICFTSFPKSLNYIGSYAFVGCSGLSEITFLGTPRSISFDAFGAKGTVVGVPDSTVKVVNVPWSKGAVYGAPWGCKNAVINYDYVPEE